MKKNRNRNFFFAITIRRIRSFYWYKNLARDIYTLSSKIACWSILVEAAKIVSSPSRSIAVVEGESIPLVCRATGHPTPTVTWTKDGKSFGGTGENVTIIKSTRDDKGTYTCTATNGVKGDQTSTTTVTVNCKLILRFHFARLKLLFAFFCTLLF